MPLPLELDKDADAPLYVQLYDALRLLILQGELEPGSRLPPSRTLARQQAVSRVTVTQAYDRLRAEGYITTRQGSGAFVAQPLPLPAADSEPVAPLLSPWGQRVLANGGAREQRSAPGRFEIDFGFGRSFPHIFPYDIWRRLLARYLSTDDAMLSRYGSVAGFEPLRAAIAGYLARWRGVYCEPEQIVIVNGAQQALDILSRLLLEAGDRVLVETPGYTDAFALFRVHGATLLPQQVDEHGFPAAALSPQTKARLAFVTPTNQFPRGGAMPLSRRLALLQWAQTVGSVIVEDDYDGALRYEGEPLAALQGLDEAGCVLYLGTFSKVLFPALRLGYVVVPPPLQQAFVQAKGIVDRGAPTLTQAAVADFITGGHFERHLRRLRKSYGRRREVLVEALRDHFGDVVTFAAEPAGLHVMVYLPSGSDEAGVVAAAAARGVGVYPGSVYHLEQDPPPSILLGFSGLAEAAIEEGVDRLAEVIG